LGRGGFTLIEVVVTLCIVAIFTAIAVPGFRKATEDFRFNTVLQDTLDIMKACRNYYLIFNEFPPNMSNGIPDRLLPLVPKYLIDPNKGNDEHGKATIAHQWTHKALGKYDYHVNNFMGMTYKPHSMGVSLYQLKRDTADWSKCYNKFKSCLGERYITEFSPRYDRMFCILPECPAPTDLNSDTLWEDRYY
jgi:prepilin-type N-terminal cleavage/methylation domain-containing protein